MKIKTIDIQGKLWFDRTYGNSYHAARVTVNFGMKDEKTYYAPFRYGYGDQYAYSGLNALEAAGVFPRRYTPCEVREAGIILRYTCQEDCLKRDVKAWGEE